MTVENFLSRIYYVGYRLVVAVFSLVLTVTLAVALFQIVIIFEDFSAVVRELNFVLGGGFLGFLVVLCFYFFPLSVLLFAIGVSAYITFTKAVHLFSFRERRIIRKIGGEIKKEYDAEEVDVTKKLTLVDKLRLGSKPTQYVSKSKGLDNLTITLKISGDGISGTNEVVFVSGLKTNKPLNTVLEERIIDIKENIGNEDVLPPPYLTIAGKFDILSDRKLWNKHIIENLRQNGKNVFLISRIEGHDSNEKNVIKIIKQMNEAATRLKE